MATLTITWNKADTAPGEPQITLTAKDTFSVEGNVVHPGDTFTPPLRVGLGIVGSGAASEVGQ